MIKCGIYIIRNIITNDVWVGQSGDIKQRWRDHRSDLRNGKNSPYLQNAYNFYGAHNFTYSIYMECSFGRLGYWEGLVGDQFNAYDRDHGYCIERPTEDGGKIIAEETKQKISENHADVRGKNNPMWGKRGELCCLWGKRGELSINWGRKASPETLKKLSIATSGKNNPMYGKQHSPETKEKIRQKRLGTKQSPETISKKSGENNYWWGKKRSAESSLKTAIGKGAKPFVVFRGDEKVGEWINQRRCARELKINRSSMRKCLDGVRTSFKGYTFAYK